MSRKPRRYFVFLLIGLITVSSAVFSGCDPHRSGAVVKQGGATRSSRYHTRPASAKSPRKNKY